MHPAFEQAFRVAVRVVTLDVARKHSKTLLENAVQDSLAGTNRLVGSEAAVATHDGRESVDAVFSQQDGGLIRRDSLENSLQHFFL